MLKGRRDVGREIRPLRQPMAARATAPRATNPRLPATMAPLRPMMEMLSLLFLLLLLAAAPAVRADDLGDCNQVADPDRTIGGCTNLLGQGISDKGALSTIY